MQHHRQTVALRQPKLLKVEMLLALAQGADAKLRHKEVQPDLAYCYQTRVCQVLLQGLIQRGQCVVARLRHKQRVDAQTVAVAMQMREFTNSGEVASMNRRQNAVHYILCSS